MKLKRILSGVLAAAVAVSSMALSAFTTSYAAETEYLWTGTFTRKVGVETTSITDGMTVKNNSGNYMTFSGVDLSEMTTPTVEILYTGDSDTVYISTSSWKDIGKGTSTEDTVFAIPDGYKSTTSFIVTTNNQSAPYGTITSVRFYDAAASQKTVVAAYEVGAENASDVIATIYDDGSMVISGTGAMTDYTNTTVPWRVDGNADTVKSVVVEEGVTNVSKYAFRYNTSIESVTLASTVTTIGNYAFYGCTNENLVIDIKGTSVVCNTGCFNTAVVGTIYVYDVETYNNVSSKATKANVVYKGELPASGKAGETATYTYDKETKTLTISGAGSISENLGLFVGSTEKIIIEDGLTSVTEKSNISKFTNAVITAPTTGTFDSDKSNWFYDAETKTLTLTKNKSTSISSDTTSLMNLYKGQVESIIISGAFSSIGANAIADYTALKTLKIPSSVKSIDNNGIKNCGNEDTIIYIDSNMSEFYCYANSFLGTKGTLSVANLLPLNKLVMQGLSNNIVYRGEKTTSGKAGNNISWTYNTDTKTLTFIGTGSFYYGTNAPSKLTYYGLYANEAEKVVINEGITSLADVAFENYKALTYVSIPSTVTQLGQYAFSGCSNDKLIVDIKSSSYPGIYSGTTFGKFVGTVNVYSETNYDYVNGLEPFKSGTANVVLKRSVSTLDEKITAGEAFNADDYTEDSYSILSEAIIAGKIVLENTEASQEEIDVAAKAISDAIDTLVKADTSDVKASLAELVEKIEKLLTVKDESDYTSESWTALSTALAAAKTDEELTVSGYTALYDNLSEAYSGLTILAAMYSEYIGTIYGGYEVTFNHETDSYKIVVSDDVDMESVVGTSYVKVTFTPSDTLKDQIPYGTVYIWNFLDNMQKFGKYADGNTLSGTADNVLTYSLSIPSTSTAFSLTAGTGWKSDNEVFFVKSVSFYNSDDELLYTYDSSKIVFKTATMDELKAAVTAAKELNQDDYTSESFEILSLVLEEVEPITAGGADESEEYAVMISEIEAAVNALKAVKPIIVTGTVSGTIKVSDENSETEMTVTAVSSDGTETIVTATSMGAYTIENLEAGNYTLTISGGKYAERSYEITVAEGENSWDVELNPLGDINGDGQVTTADVGKANSHAKGVTTLTDYDFACADVKNDGSITTADVGMINSHAKGVSTLW